MAKGVSAATVLRKLGKEYAPPRTFLDHDTTFHLLVATILSAQCTDVRVNIVTKTLFKKYRGPKDFVATPLEVIQKDIYSCGHYRNKARFLQESGRMILEEFKGEVPGTMEELLRLPGVGRKTATVILYAAFRKEEGIAVDTHVWRVSKRLGLTKANTQSRIELDLMKQTPREEWGKLHVLLISHGRKVCVARNRLCEACVFQRECPSSKVLGRPDLAKIASSPKIMK